MVSQSEREPMMIPTTGCTSLTRLRLLRARLLQEQRRNRGRCLPHVRFLLVGAGHPVEDLDRLALRGSVPETHDREPPDRSVGIACGELVQQRAKRVDVARVVARETLERDQGRAASGRAL